MKRIRIRLDEFKRNPQQEAQPQAALSLSVALRILPLAPILRDCRTIRSPSRSRSPKALQALPDIIPAMSFRAEYGNGVFKPLVEVSNAVPGEMYEVFSEGELRRLAEGLRWLKGSERSFEFWENGEDAVYDRL